MEKGCGGRPNAEAEGPEPFARGFGQQHGGLELRGRRVAVEGAWASTAQVNTEPLRIAELPAFRTSGGVTSRKTPDRTKPDGHELRALQVRCEVNRATGDDSLSAFREGCAVVLGITAATAAAGEFLEEAAAQTAEARDRGLRVFVVAGL